ncbi:hypothetical protein K490DRAFT_40309 [Saccharata proteae CBS 121410]|uniref:DUF7892 domain-containing protein n=1 Tax=Saccharata proteae CBS 121410 TaxID=1314787 RepID=A0A9P4HXJ6_9PEZI|nr:hypothetical protein K490DRAFT_40309 [Saccharata proteae CBS 121410]
MDHTWGSVGTPSTHHPYRTSTPQDHWNGRPVAANASWGKRKADDAADAADKRRRVDAPSAATIPSCARLPAQVWQNIFLYLPPVDLGRLLQVNRAFHTYLTQVAEPSNGSQRFPGRLRLLGSETIWSSARKLHFPSLPKPLLTHAEWAMWSLLKSRRCQFCGLMPRDLPALDGIGETGPGSDGVRVVWPFGIRSCALNNASISSLLAAVPFIYVTQDRNIVPSSSATSTPPNVELTRWYYRDHLREIQRQFEDVQAFGHATTEEWYKGLSATGKRKLADADRWERLERKGGAAFQPRSERSIRDANEAKAARKADIERRCQGLNPPIHPNVLRHMKAFQAACQISTPMTDRAWEMLRPRIEAQRSEAEQIEHERAAQMAALQVKLEDRRTQDASIKEVKEVLEREWEETQRPVRERLGAYADEIIDKDWMEGQAVTRENTAQFAAELLIRVRERFYADQCQEDEATLAAGEEIREDPPAGPPTRRLILENMKWVFDNKIKPLTDPYRKELFLCNGEGCEGPPGYPGNMPYGQYPYGGFSQGPSSTPNPESRTPLHFSHVSPGYGQPGPPANGPFPPPSTTSAGYFGNPAYQGPPYAPPAGPYNNNYPSSSFAPPSLVPNYSGGWGVSRPHSSHMVSSAFPPRGGPVPANMHDDEIRVLTDVAREIWTSTSGIRNLPASVRLSVVIHHVVYHFNLRFGIEPSLNLFADALESHASMQDLKSIDNLSCKACAMGFHDHAMPSPSRDQEKISYDVLSLFLHFRSIHVERISSASQGFNINSHFQLDWKRDMVELPDDDLISGLIQSPGINDFKLRIVAEAFPRLFPAPLPHIGTVTSREPSPLGEPVREPTEFRTESAVRPSMAREEPPELRTGSARGFEERASIRPSGDHVPTSDRRSSYPHPGNDRYGPPAPEMEHHEREPRRDSRQRSRRLSPHPDERRSRVYYEEPRYYVSWGFDNQWRSSC